MLKVAIYESLQHFVPGGVGWYEGLEDLGHDPYILESEHDLNAYQLPEAPDILAVMDVNPKVVDYILIFKEKYPTTKIIANFFGYQDYYLKLKEVVDLWVEPVMKHDYIKKIFEEKGLPLLLLPLGATRSLFTKTATEKIYDVSFVGRFGTTGHGYRDQNVYLYPVIDKGYKSFYGGFSYKGVNYPYVEYNALNELYNSTKVNLNFHYDHQKREDLSQEVYRLDFNTRVYEIALSNNFQISDHPEVVNIFNGAVPYVEKENWLDAIDYYLDNPNLRKELSNKAYEICSQNHLWKHRMIEVLNTLYKQ